MLFSVLGLVSVSTQYTLFPLFQCFKHAMAATATCLCRSDFEVFLGFSQSWSFVYSVSDEPSAVGLCFQAPVCTD